MKKVFSILAFAACTILFTSCDKSGPTKDGTGYVVQPTWGESFHYAKKATPSQTPYTVAAIALVIIGIVAFIKWIPTFKDPMWPIVAVVFICFIGGLVCFFSKPSAIRINNVKTVPIEYYKEKGQTFILDSLFESNHLIDAAVK